MRPIYYSREGRSITRGMLMLGVVWCTSFVIAMPVISVNKLHEIQEENVRAFNALQ